MTFKFSSIGVALISLLMIAQTPVQAAMSGSSTHVKSRTARVQSGIRAAKHRATSTSKKRSVASARKVSKKGVAAQSKIASKSSASKPTRIAKKSSARKPAKIAKKSSRSKLALTRKSKRAKGSSGHNHGTIASVAGRRSMWSAPAYDMTPYSPKLQRIVKDRFSKGIASALGPEDMVRANVFVSYPMRGGIFIRRSDIKHIIVHSTETARIADGPRVIRSWNNMGFTHPGTQYVVDRDGLIYQTVDPKYGTTHVNSAITLGGVNNDNSIGIEIVRAGKQKYTSKQLASAARLVDYLKDRFSIASIYGHGQIQPRTRTDPVAFDWSGFNKRLVALSLPGPKNAYSPQIASSSAPGKVNAQPASRKPQPKQTSKKTKPALPKETAYLNIERVTQLFVQLIGVVLF